MGNNNLTENSLKKPTNFAEKLTNLASPLTKFDETPDALPITGISNIFSSCSKSGGEPIVPPDVVYKDTLSSGWTKNFVRDSALQPLVLSDIVAQNNSVVYTVTPQLKTLFKSTDGGTTWNKVPAFSDSSVYNLAVTPDGKVFAANGSNFLSRSANQGASFSKINTGNQNFFDTYFVDNNVGYCVTYNTLIRSVDGGATWVTISPTSGLVLHPTIYSTGVFFNNGTAVIFSASDVFRTDGSLNSWTRSLFTGRTPTGFIQSIYAVSPTHIFLVETEGYVYESTNGGTSFSLKSRIVASPAFYIDIHFVDDNTGYLSVANRIYKTTDAGSSWQVVVAMRRSIITEIYFTDANHGWGSTDASEVIKLN